MTEIHLVLIGQNNNLYDAGLLKVEKSGDVYHVPKPKLSGESKPSDLHLSRHKDGTTHWRFQSKKRPLRKGEAIGKFVGFEPLQTVPIKIAEVPSCYVPYEFKSKVADGIFCIDLRGHPGEFINIMSFILTKEGLPEFYTQAIAIGGNSYVHTASHPMIGIIVK